MKTTKLITIIAALFVVAGLLIAGIGMILGGKFSYSYIFDKGKIKVNTGSDNYVSETVSVGDFEKLEIEASTVDIDIIPTDKEGSVSYYVSENKVPEISTGKTLSIIFNKNEIGFFNMHFGEDEQEKITVYVPNADSEKKFKIHSSTGHISIENTAFEGELETSTGAVSVKDVKAGEVEIKVSTGKIYIDNAEFEKLKTNGSTGKVQITDTRTEKYTAKTSTGDIKLQDFTAEEMKVDGSTSDITALNSKIGEIKIEVSTGRTNLELIGSRDDYSCDFSTSTGDIQYDGNIYEKNYEHSGSGNGKIKVESSTGDIIVNFR